MAPLLRRIGMLSAERASRLSALDSRIRHWDLRKRLPMDSGVADLVYHSHVLEHFEHAVAKQFVSECYRILRNGGTLRVVVPDLEVSARGYLNSVERRRIGASDRPAHERATRALLEQLVRRDLPATPRGGPLAILERLLRGDAARAGDAHRWMYDELSLTDVLLDAGFTRVVRRDPSTSGVADWGTFLLDVNADGTTYKPGSLYVEATRSS
jgi:SAM-dependent methyltransferase